MATKSPPKYSYRQVLSIRGLPRLALASLLARIGGRVWEIAIVLFALQKYHSPTLAGLVAFLSIMPGLAISPVAGALLDKLGRVKLIILDYVIAGITLALIVALSHFDLLPAWLLMTIVGVSSLSAPLSITGTRSLIPMIVPRELWDRANAIDSGTDVLSTIIGPALAGVLVGAFGGEFTLLVDAVVFVIAGAVLVPMREKVPLKIEPRQLIRDAHEGVIYVLRHPTLRGLAMSLSVSGMGMGFLTVALPVLTFQRLHQGAQLIGALWAVMGAIGLVSGLIFGRFNTEGREREIIAAGIGLSGVGIFLLSFMNSIQGVVIALMIVGLTYGPIDITLFSLRQRRTDAAWFGRAVAVSMSLNFAGMPVGSAISGPILDRSVAIALWVAALTAAVAVVITLYAIPKQDTRAQKLQ